MATYNLKSPSVKRILTEAKELRDPTDLYYAQPLEENIFEWHFTVRGPDDTPFAGGIYHGRILLPNEYPFKPPSIILLTPNGRFELNKKICLSISAYHPEYWRPSWSIRTVLLALISFLPTDGRGTIGSLEYSDEERAALAKKSPDWVCPTCGVANKDAVLPVGSADNKAAPPSAADAEAIAQIAFKGAAPPAPDAGDKKDDNARDNGTPENQSEASDGVPSTGSPAPPAAVTPPGAGLSSHGSPAPARSPTAASEPQARAPASPRPATPPTQVLPPPPRQTHSLGDLTLTFLIWAVAGAILALLMRKFSRL